LPREASGWSRRGRGMPWWARFYGAPGTRPGPPGGRVRAVRSQAPGEGVVRLHEGEQDQQVGDAEAEAQGGAPAPGGAARQGQAREHDGERSEDDVEDEQAEQAQDEGRDGHAVGVADSGAVGGPGGELHEDRLPRSTRGRTVGGRDGVGGRARRVPVRGQCAGPRRPRPWRSRRAKTPSQTAMTSPAASVKAGGAWATVPRTTPSSRSAATRKSMVGIPQIR